MHTFATLVLGYLVAKAVVLLALALVSEWLHPTRTTRRAISSPFSIELG